MTRFILETNPIPVAYIDLVDKRRNSDSKTQVVVDISRLNFTPRELIFDVNKDDQVIGVEIL